MTDIHAIAAHPTVAPMRVTRATPTAAAGSASHPPTREEWLQAAVRELRGDLASVGSVLPGSLQVSVAWPATARRRVIGEFWRRSVASDGQNHIFISPLLDGPATVLSTLVHELVHAVDGCRSGHEGEFARIARLVGLEGPMRSTSAGPDLAMRLNGLASVLGLYPHGALRPNEPGARRQTTRLVKAVCPNCGYPIWTSRRWLIDDGRPFCPDGTRMEVEWSPVNPPTPRRPRSQTAGTDLVSSHTTTGRRKR